MVVDGESDDLDLYVTHQAFVKSRNPYTFYSEKHRAYWYATIATEKASKKRLLPEFSPQDVVNVGRLSPVE